jgi:hypothetical protein
MVRRILNSLRNFFRRRLTVDCGHPCYHSLVFTVRGGGTLVMIEQWEHYTCSMFDEIFRTCNGGIFSLLVMTGTVIGHRSADCGLCHTHVFSFFFLLARSGSAGVSYVQSICYLLLAIVAIVLVHCYDLAVAVVVVEYTRHPRQWLLVQVPHKVQELYRDRHLLLVQMARAEASSCH